MHRLIVGRPKVVILRMNRWKKRKLEGEEESFLLSVSIHSNRGFISLRVLS